MSEWMLWVFIAEFIVLAAFASHNGQSGLLFYSIGGAILNFGVIMMNQ